MEIVFITGTSTGIGYETALRLARTGYRVYASMRNPQRSPRLGEIAIAENLDIKIVAMDVTNLKNVQEIFSAVLQQESHIDILINNAGIAGHGAVEEATMELFRANMETNYFGVVHCLKQVLPRMRKRRKGHIINITSLAGTIATAFHAPYSASKFALESLSESLAQEMLPYGVRVSVIQPGVITTPIFKEDKNIQYDTKYLRLYRFYLNFKNGLKLNNPPSIVAKRILKVIRNTNATFRTPSGLGASGTLAHRKSMTDEQWIAEGNISDETWCATVEKDIADQYKAIVQQAKQTHEH